MQIIVITRCEKHSDEECGPRAAGRDFLDVASDVAPLPWQDDPEAKRYLEQRQAR